MLINFFVFHFFLLFDFFNVFFFILFCTLNYYFLVYCGAGEGVYGEGGKNSNQNSMLRGRWKLNSMPDCQKPLFSFIF